MTRIDGIDGAQRIAHTVDRDQAHMPLGKKSIQRTEFQFAAIVDRNHFQFRAGCGAGHLPGNDVGVMLKVADDDDVAGGEIYPAPGGGHQVDRFGGAAGENNLGGFLRVNECADFFAGFFV